MRGPAKRTSKPKVGQLNGGEGGIRTHGTVSRTLAFEASTFNRSVTSPRSFQLILSERMLPGLCRVPDEDETHRYGDLAAGGEEGLEKGTGFFG